MNLNMMDPKLIIVLAVAVVVIIVVVALALYMRKRKNNTAELRDRFGPEYDRPCRQWVGAESRSQAGGS